MNVIDIFKQNLKFYEFVNRNAIIKTSIKIVAKTLKIAAKKVVPRVCLVAETKHKTFHQQF